MNHKDLLFNDNPVKAVTDQQTVTGAEKGSCDRFFPSGMDGVAPLHARPYAPGGRRPWLFCAAWSISSGVISTVALTLAWPAPFPASEIAAALTLSGKSTIAKTSVSPKAKYNASNFPPTDLKNCSATCFRLVPPSFARPIAPSLVKETCIRNLDILDLLVTESFPESYSSYRPKSESAAGRRA